MYHLINSGAKIYVEDSEQDTPAEAAERNGKIQTETLFHNNQENTNVNHINQFITQAIIIQQTY